MQELDTQEVLDLIEYESIVADINHYELHTK